MKIIECPRDAMQGIKSFIPTDLKVKYLNSLLKVGFDSLDFGSFVSPKAIPQLSDTAQVLDQLDLSGSRSKLLAIVANVRGAEQASEFPQIQYMGYPFSISPTFQKRNTNSTVMEAFDTVKSILEICTKTGKEPVIYISMGFGNPYGDRWNHELVNEWVEKLSVVGIKTVSLADTVGVADPETISYLFSNLIPSFPQIEIGAHFHSSPDKWEEKVDAAWQNGCRRFDSALKGYGGCPMAEDELVGNLATENLLEYMMEKGEGLQINEPAFSQAMALSSQVFT